MSLSCLNIYSKAYGLGPSCINSDIITNSTACGDGYTKAYNHFCCQPGHEQVSSDGVFSYQTWMKQGIHHYDCSYFGGQKPWSHAINDIYNSLNIIQNICSIGSSTNVTNATSCFNGYNNSWQKLCRFNLTSCETTLNQLLIGHSPTYWAGWQNGK